MARKLTVDRDAVLEMLREGRSTRQVAEHFGVTRQAIDLHRRDFISQGLLDGRRAGRPTAAARVPRTPSAPPQGPAPPASLDDLIEVAIRAFTALRELPQVQAELNRCRQERDAALAQIEALHGALATRQNQEQRWHMAQSGDLPDSSLPR